MSDAIPNELRFVVPGEPVPKGRPRAFAFRSKIGKPTARMFTPEDTRDYELLVATCCQVAVNRCRWIWSDRDRFAVSIRVYRKYEGKGGDLDNYVKAVSDAINKIAFGDDRYIRSLTASMFQDAARPRVEVEVVRMRIGEGPRRVA